MRGSLRYAREFASHRVRTGRGEKGGFPFLLHSTLSLRDLSLFDARSRDARRVVISAIITCLATRRAGTGGRERERIGKRTLDVGESATYIYTHTTQHIYIYERNNTRAYTSVGLQRARVIGSCGTAHKARITSQRSREIRVGLGSPRPIIVETRLHPRARRPDKENYVRAYWRRNTTGRARERK